jgi:hypothetical protein
MQVGAPTIRININRDIQIYMYTGRQTHSIIENFIGGETKVTVFTSISLSEKAKRAHLGYRDVWAVSDFDGYLCSWGPTLHIVSGPRVNFFALGRKLREYDVGKVWQEVRCFA